VLVGKEHVRGVVAKVGEKRSRVAEGREERKGAKQRRREKTAEIDGDHGCGLGVQV